MVQVIPSWLSTDRKAKSPSAQSVRLSLSQPDAGLFWRVPGGQLVFGLCWNLEEVRLNTTHNNRMGKLVGESEGKKAAKRRFLLSRPFM